MLLDGKLNFSKNSVQDQYLSNSMVPVDNSVPKSPLNQI